MKLRMLVQASVLACSAAATAPSLSAAPADEARERVEKAAAQIAAELLRLCPASDPGDQAAFDACRAGLYRDSQFKRSLQDYVLWGRQRDPKIALKDTKLTQFGPDVLAGMYVPLFMFNGKYSVKYVEREDLYEVRLQTAFRNRLAPGQFPYPFWHDSQKWNTYQGANSILLWIDPKTARIKIAQFTDRGATPPIVGSEEVQQAQFDNKW